MSDIVIVGAAGMLGSDLLKNFQAQGADVAGLSRVQCDVTSAKQCRDAILRLEPRIVVNCAAFTDVNAAETREADAYAVNAQGAANVAEACRLAGARCIYVSTDYVFDGDKNEPYDEQDTTHPLNAYGRTKLAGEQNTAVACPDNYCVVRTSWLYGRNGQNFVSTMLRLARAGQDLRVVNDQLGSPTSTASLASMLVAICGSQAQGVLHATCGGYCTWYDFAAEIFRQSGIAPKSLLPVSSAEFPTPARRPANSRLHSSRLAEFGLSPMPNWHEALREYIASLHLEHC